MFDINQTYIVQLSEIDVDLTNRFRDKLIWAWRILEKAEPAGLDVKKNKDAPDCIWTKFSGSFVNRLGNTKPVHIFAGVTVHNRPLVRVRIRDFQRGHDTVFQEPLRADGSNNLAPGCTIEEVQAFLNLLYGAVHKQAVDLDPEEAGERSIQPILAEVERIASALIHVSRDHDPNLKDGLFVLKAGKPYGLPEILYAPKIQDSTPLVSILREDAARVLARKLPSLIHLVEHDTRRVSGFQLGSYCPRPFPLAPRDSIVEELKMLADFPIAENGYTIPVAA